MTDQERIDRETLLKRAAAVAGAVYLAPVLTSAAAAGTEGCASFTCSKKKKKWKKKHRKKCQNSGAGCDCPAPGTPCAGGGQGCACTRQSPTACSGLEACGTGGGCACFKNGVGDSCNTGTGGNCIFAEDGLCQTFLDKHGSCPGGSDAECGAGKACFSSCCDCVHVFPKLCAECCNGRSAGALARAGSGAGTIYA